MQTCEPEKLLNIDTTELASGDRFYLLDENNKPATKSNTQCVFVGTCLVYSPDLFLFYFDDETHYITMRTSHRMVAKII